MNALEIKNLSKSFGSLKAVDDVSFSVPEGCVYGLLGRNGAGKTTTIRMMMNIYEPDSGEIILKGTKVGQEFRNNVGYLPEERGLYKKMKVLDTILYFAELKGKSNKEVMKSAEEYLEIFNLADRKNSKIEDLSKGNQQKIQFITTILHDPEFLILDEPFSGLDPINTDLLMDLIMNFKKKGKIIILSTHLMDFAEKMCDNIALINKGKLILNGSMGDVKSKYSKKSISLNYSGDITFLKNHPIVEKISDAGNSSIIKIKDEKDTQMLLQLLVNNNVQVQKFSANDISLHEIFVSLAGEEEVANA